MAETICVPATSAPTLTPAARYVCGLPHDLELTKLPGDDLAAKVQHALTQIVAELHLISGWSAECLTAQAPLTPKAAIVAADLELMRRDMSVAQQELAQRCSSQIKSAQSAIQGDLNDRFTEMQQRMEGLIDTAGRQTSAQDGADRGEAIGRLRTLEAMTRQVQTRAVDDHDKLMALENSSAATSSALAKLQVAQQTEITSIVRRVDAAHTALTLQLADVREDLDEAVSSVRAVQEQLAAKINVFRLELHEQRQDIQRKLNHGTKRLNSGINDAHKVAASPSLFSISSPRTARVIQSNGGVSTTNSNAAPTIEAKVDTFLYAKAALPHRESPSGGSRPASARTKPPTMNIPVFCDANLREYSIHERNTGRLTSRDRTTNISPVVISNLLRVQPAVLSQPFGYDEVGELEDSSREVEDDSSDSAPSPHTFQTSRLYTTVVSPKPPPH